MLSEKELISKYLGIPFIHKGRTLAGVDCWGLIKLIYKDFGYKLWDLEEYSVDWQAKGGNHFIDNYWREYIKISIPKFFDIVLLKRRKNNIVSHIGLVLSKNRMLHCTKIGVCISKYNKTPWLEKVEGFYRYKYGTN